MLVIHFIYIDITSTVQYLWFMSFKHCTILVIHAIYTDITSIVQYLWFMSFIKILQALYNTCDSCLLYSYYKH